MNKFPEHRRVPCITVQQSLQKQMIKMLFLSADYCCVAGGGFPSIRVTNFHLKSCCDTNRNYCDLPHWLAGTTISRRILIRIGVNPCLSGPCCIFSLWELTSVEDKEHTFLVSLSSPCSQENFWAELINLSIEESFCSKLNPSFLTGCLSLSQSAAN